MRNMKFEDFFINIACNNGDWDTYCDAAYWSDEFSCEKAYKWLLRLAARQNVILVDKDTVDYDSILYPSYKDTEKGLS